MKPIFLSLLRLCAHPGVWLVIIITLQTLLFGSVGMAADPGVGWHLATGLWVDSFKGAPLVDPFLSVTRPWISDQWLSDFFLYRVYDWFSWPGVYLFVIGSFSVTIFVLHFRKLQSLLGTTLCPLLGCLFAIKAMHIHLLVRPVIFSFVFFTFLIWNMVRWEKEKKGSFLLVPLFCLWANMHPSFILGIGLMLLAFVVSVLKGTFSFQKLLLVVIASGVTVLNPYGIELHRSIVWLGQSAYFMNLHQEWLPPTHDSSQLFVALCLLCLGVLPAIIFEGIRNRAGLFITFASIIFAGLAFKAVRFVPYFGILASVLMAVSFQWLFWKRRNARLLVLPIVRLEKFFKPGRAFTPISSMVFIGVLGVWGLSTGKLPLTPAELGPPKNRFPYQAVNAVMQSEGGNIVAATPDWGGFIVWHGKGGLKPIIDDRNTLLGEEFVKSYYDSMESPSGLVDWGRRNGAQWLLLRKADQAAEGVRQMISPYFEDDVAVLFSLRTPPIFHSGNTR